MNLKYFLLLTASALAMPAASYAESFGFENPGITSDPPQGEVGTLQRIALTYDGQQGVFANPYQYSITVCREGEEESLMGATADTDPKQWNILQISLERTLREPGTYVITLPYGFVQDWDYAPLPESKWMFKVTGNDDSRIEFEPYVNHGADISPRQGIYNKIGEDFRLNFDYESIGVNNAKMIRMIDDETGVVCGTFSIDYTFTDDGLAVLNQFVLKSDREVSAPGSYTLQFPDGTFYRSSDNEDIGAFNFRYVVSEQGQVYAPDPSYSFVYPSSSSAVRQLERLVVTFPDFETARPSLNGNIKAFDATGKEVGTGVALATKEKIGKNQVPVIFNPAITAEGEYTVIISEGSITVGENGDTNSKITLAYNVNPKASDPSDPNSPYDNRGVTIYPEQGCYKSLNTFLLTFDCDKTGINFSNMIKVYNDETGEVAGTCGIDYGAKFGKEVTADVLPYMNKPGTYTIVFPQGTFYDYGKEDEPEMPIYKFRYVIAPNGEVVNPVSETVLANPASGSELTSLKSIDISFPEFSKIERSHVVDQLNIEIKVVDKNGETVSEGILDQTQAGLSPNSMKVNFDPEVIAGGDYDILFARRVFILGEDNERRFNEDFSLRYSIKSSGVDSVVTDNEAAPTIYTLSGARATETDRPGVYIIIDSQGKATKLVR